MVENDAKLAALMFTAGAHAERNAKQLAQVLADSGDQAQVVVHDRTGVVVGSVVYGPGRDF
jgi:hypothetical protein